MYYGNIKDCDIADGAGVRVTLFVSGCTHHCKGCFQPQTWDFRFGLPYTQETEDRLIAMLAPDYIDGLTFLGGEPFEPANQEPLLRLARRAKALYPQKTIWCYTGYTLESDLLAASRARCEYTDDLLSCLDVLVDGEFVEEKKNLAIAFRGSENQRIINVPATLSTGRTVLLQLDRNLSKL